MMTQIDIFGSLECGGMEGVAGGGVRECLREGRKELEQFFLPEWAAEAIVEQRFSPLGSSASVLDAGCGRGAFLKAIPSHVRAVGVEVDPSVAEFARGNTGRDVLVGDFRTLDLPFQPTLILSNPPFSLASEFLQRAFDLLPQDGQCGFVLPSSSFSFASTLARWSERFSIQQDSIPRDLFPRIGVPLSFFTLTKERVRRLHGFLLFEECAAMKGVPKNVKLALINGADRKSPWRVAVETALRSLGGRATLEQIYAAIAGRLPRLIKTWQATVRRVLQEGGFVNVGRGEWAIAGGVP